MQHFMYWFDSQEPESNREGFVKENYFGTEWVLFFFFSPFLATVTNSLRYKIKIMYFVINILIHKDGN